MLRRAAFATRLRGNVVPLPTSSGCAACHMSTSRQTVRVMCARVAGRVGMGSSLASREAQSLCRAIVGTRTWGVNRSNMWSGVRYSHDDAGDDSGAGAGAGAGSGDDDGNVGNGAGREPLVAMPGDPMRHPGLPEMFEGEQYEVLATETEQVSSGDDDIDDDDDDEMDEDEWLARKEADEYRTSDSEGFPRGVIGDGIEGVPLSVLEHISNPLDMNLIGVEKVLDEIERDLPLLNPKEGDDDSEGGPGFGQSYNPDESSDDPGASFVRPDRTEEAHRMDEYRKLREKIEDPVAVPLRPLWPLYTQIIQVDTVTVMGSRGQEGHTRVLTIVGNKQGAAGFGIGKHSEPNQATKLSLRNAQRNMIHINTYNGQLYHDLIGKKNNTQVLIRSVPPRMGSRGSRLISTVMEFMGVKHFSAKIVGSKTKNRYTIVQALFDAFNNYTPPEEFAYKRGKRFVFVGKDRRYPREVFPFYPRGPRHQPNTHRKL